MNVRSITGIIAAALLGLALMPTAASAQQNHISKRLERQQARIQEGVNSGRLNHHEAHTLRARDRKIHESAVAMRARNNGKLTKLDRRLLDDRLNANSKSIDREKHNHRMRH